MPLLRRLPLTGLVGGEIRVLHRDERSTLRGIRHQEHFARAQVKPSFERQVCGDRLAAILPGTGLRRISSDTIESHLDSRVARSQPYLVKDVKPAVLT